jgi:hypothetical protein
MSRHKPAAVSEPLVAVIPEVVAPAAVLAATSATVTAVIVATRSAIAVIAAVALVLGLAIEPPLLFAVVGLGRLLLGLGVVRLSLDVRCALSLGDLGGVGGRRGHVLGVGHN